ncbi:MAG: glucokinase [Betaproteobacteria bacterium]|nr:glucokinase [Betaproteobacteria bacterium]
MYRAKAPCSSDRPGWPRLIGDIGGTNIRFAWLEQAGEAFGHVRVLASEAFVGPAHAIGHYLAQTGLPRPDCVALGLASPVRGDAVTMTNLAWKFSVEGLRAEFGLQHLLVVNDFAALALAIPTLSSDRLRSIGPRESARHGPIGLLGAGTGLGVSGLLPVPGQPGRWVPVMGEGGHVTLAAESELEFAIIQFIKRRHDHVSAERVLSGVGLVELYDALNHAEGQKGQASISAAEIMEWGVRQPSSAARRVLELFCGWLGSVAGNVALTLGAHGGVYIGGGIAPRMREVLIQSSFRQRFVDKGRFRTYLEGVPTWLIDSVDWPTLNGAALALEWSCES